MDAARLDWPSIVQALLAYAVPMLVFLFDYRYFGPIVRFGPFIVWTAAALGMAGFAAIGRARGNPLLSGVLGAFLLGGALLSIGMALITMPIVLVAKSFTLTVLGAGLLGTAFFYMRRWLAARRAGPRTRASTAGGLIGVVLLVALPLLVQWLHDRHFANQLAHLEDSDPLVRERTLKSLVGSRFCWHACSRAVCEARSDLDAETVRAVLGSNDVELTCDEPGLGEWPG